MSELQQEQALAVQTTPASAGMDEGMNIDMMEMLYRLLASWKMILCLALVGAVLAGWYTENKITPMYRATSTIYVLSRRDSAINMSDLQLGSALTSDYLKVFNIWELHEEVISNLGLPYSYGHMRGMVSVSNSGGTRMLDISVTSPDPEEAARVANEYASVGSQFIADTMSTDKPNIMSVALVPTSPISPNKTRNIMMGLLLGGGLAAAVVVLRVMLDDKYKTADDIRKYTGLPTLAVLPVQDNAPSKRQKSRRAERRRA